MLQTIHFFLITIILVIVAIIDSEYKKIPNRYVIMIAALSGIYIVPRILFFGDNPVRVFTGVVVGACVLLPAFILTGKSFGAGDIKIFMALGISLGGTKLLLCVLITMVGAFAYYVFKRAGRVSCIAMAPFILFGYIIVGML